MSWQAFVWCSSEEVTKADINAGEYALLTAMAKYADEWGRGVFAGVEKYGDITHQSRATVQRALRGLEAAGLIVEAKDQSPAAQKRAANRRATVYDLVYSAKFKRWVKADMAERMGPAKPKGRSRGHLRAV